jgi:hypothetical protein
MADAPAYDCATSVQAVLSSDGAAYEFDATALVGDGALAVAILPTAPTDRVVLSPPTADSLTVADGASATPGVDAAPSREPTDDDVASSAAPTVPAASASASRGAAAPRPASSAPAVPSPSPAAAPAAPAASSTPAASPSAPAAPTAQDGGSSGDSLLPAAAFVGLAALAASLWFGRRADDDELVSVPQPA